MTPRFILDENVVICAQLETNVHGNPDITCARLITQIIEICYTLVLDVPLWESYLRQLNRPLHQTPQSGSVFARVLANAFQRQGKVDFRTTSAAFAEVANIPQGSQDDVPVVRLAVHTGATLVTTDEALRADLNSSGIREKYNLQVLSPEEALLIL